MFNIEKPKPKSVRSFKRMLIEEAPQETTEQPEKVDASEQDRLLRCIAHGKLLPEVAQFLQEEKRVILSFSGGKDSLACWCLLKELGIEVFPFYMYHIKGMSWIEEYLAYCEEFFGCHIARVLHPSMYHRINTYAGQPPERKALIDFLRLPNYTYDDVNEGIRRASGFGDNAWIAVGTRAVDNPIRWRAFCKAGWKRYKNHTVHVVGNFRKDDVISTLRRHGVKLSPCYRLFGRSFDGLYYQYLEPVRQHYPEDYKRILEWMPLCHAEQYRVKFAVKHGIGRVL